MTPVDAAVSRHAARSADRRAGFRSQGIGEALVTRSLEAAREAGWKLVILVGDEPYTDAWDSRPFLPAASRCQVRWTPAACLTSRTHARRAGGGEGGGAGAGKLYSEDEKIYVRRPFAALSGRSNNGSLISQWGHIGKPPRGGAGFGHRRIAALSAVGSRARRSCWRSSSSLVARDLVLEGLAVLGAGAARRLGHRLADEPAARVIHGHPTPWRAVNEAIGVWPLSLWLPFSKLSRNPYPASPGRKPHRPVRGPRKLLLDFRGMPRPGRPIGPSCRDSTWSGGFFSDRLDDRALRSRFSPRRVAGRERRPPNLFGTAFSAFRCSCG